MGCVLGNFGFDCAVNRVYAKVKTEYTKATQKSLTDDFTAASTPDELCIMLPRVKALAWEECGLKLNISK